MLQSNYVRNIFYSSIFFLKMDLKHTVFKEKEKGAMLFYFAQSGTFVA
jgi:hypothetical protein